MLPKALTPELIRAVEQLSENRRRNLRELRLRMGGSVRGVFPWGEELVTLDGRPIHVTEMLLKTMVDRATGFSPYAMRLEESELYLPLEGGCRMGLCGEAVMRDGRLQGLRNLNSIVIRLASEQRGFAEQAARSLTRRGWVESVLIVSPPGMGKTTFLRDLIRSVSQRGFRVAVADERRELAAVQAGVPQLDMGPCTDVLSGCPKAQAMRLLLRVMTPQVLAVDELAAPEELEVAREAAHCGVALFATAHGGGLNDLIRRPGYAALLHSGAFGYLAVIREYGTVKMERLDGYGKVDWRDSGGAGFSGRGLGRTAGAAAAGESPAAAPPGLGADAGGNGDAYAPCGRAV